jgi:hypothetical protein
MKKTNYIKRVSRTIKLHLGSQYARYMLYKNSTVRLAAVCLYCTPPSSYFSTSPPPWTASAARPPVCCRWCGHVNAQASRLHGVLEMLCQAHGRGGRAGLAEARRRGRRRRPENAVGGAMHFLQDTYSTLTCTRTPLQDRHSEAARAVIFYKNEYIYMTVK